MEPTKRLYETTFIVNASIEDTQIENVVTHVQEVITRNGGEITAMNRWGRKRLAYPIQKKNNGFYVNIEFIAPGQTLSQLERSYQLDENILRFLTIQLDKRAIESRERQQAQAAQAAADTPGVASPGPVEPAPAAQTPVEGRKPLFEDEAKPSDTQTTPNA
jgi:small subunit ribosomal protein S6